MRWVEGDGVWGVFARGGEFRFDSPCASLCPTNDASKWCRGDANGLTTVTPPQVKPSWRPSDTCNRHPACEATARMTASQMLSGDQ